MELSFFHKSWRLEKAFFLFRGLLYTCLSASVLLQNPDVAVLLDCLQVLHSIGYLSKRKDFHVLSR